VNRGFGSNKRQREDERARKQRDKAARRAEKREIGPRELEVVSAADMMRDLPSIEEAMRRIEAGPTEVRSASTIPARLFVGGLTDDTTEQDLRDAFGQFGPVADVIVMRDRESRAPRGFGFVTMGDRRDAPRAIDGMHGAILNGRSLVVNVATERR
jgi:RNA recognition motif-containing protein